MPALNEAVPESSDGVTSQALHDLRCALRDSESALGVRLQDGISSLSSRMDLLHENLESATFGSGSIVQASSKKQSNADESEARRRMEETLSNVLSDQLPTVRSNLESVTDRVTGLEEAAAAAVPAPVFQVPSDGPGLNAEAAASAAADAAREAMEETQARILAEMSALEERVDRRARDEARRTREEREAAETRGSMQRMSTTIAAYTADLAVRLEGLQLEHEKQGTEVARANEEIAAAEMDLKSMGSELMGLGQVANNVSWARLFAYSITDRWGDFRRARTISRKKRAESQAEPLLTLPFVKRSYEGHSTCSPDTTGPHESPNDDRSKREPW